MFATHKILETRLLQILAEDVGQGDITVTAIVPADTIVEGEIIAHENGVAAGIEEVAILAKSLDLKIEALVGDGDIFANKDVIAKVSGNARTILTAERTILNLLSRMSGIATMTKKLKETIRRAGFNTKIAATRKTAPGLLFFDKKAVQIGGGDTHRLHLDDLILLKDNHITIAGNVVDAVKKARMNSSFTKKIEVEVKRPEEAKNAANGGADIIMLDNFTPEQTKETIDLLRKMGQIGKITLESSGGITAENILEYASTGVNVLSVGEITHSVKNIDISLEITRVL